jgi:hypothetical protein
VIDAFQRHRRAFDARRLDRHRRDHLEADERRLVDARPYHDRRCVDFLAHS